MNLDTNVNLHAPKPDVLAYNYGHDGSIACLRDHSLSFLWEAEKDNNLRHAPASAIILFEAVQRLGDAPTIVATSGEYKGDSNQVVGAGYHGAQDTAVRRSRIRLLGQDVSLYETTHERSHLFCSYGLSPLPQGEPCYVLLWEGRIGSFYEVDERLRITRLASILDFPGYKYSFLYDLADPRSPFGKWRLDTAGKLMALAGYSRRSSPSAQELRLIEQIMSEAVPPYTSKHGFQGSLYLNCGVTEPAFVDLIARFSDAVFSRFYEFAKAHLTKGYPLLIGGGCGLNCEWNSRWRESGLFSDVFVPPVTNDSGCALGAAIDAQHYLDGCAKVSWDVYRGAEFIDEGLPPLFRAADMDFDALAEFLAQEKVVAWVQGRCEVGPRALGNRSLLGSPFKRDMRDRLNFVKQREPYRPVAPVCLEADAEELFGARRSSPYMLYFHLAAPGLGAVTHVDGSARVQTVSNEENPRLYRLLLAFKKRTGYGVLCNTSLNFPGRGFINRTSDVFRYAVERGIEGVVINDQAYLSVQEDARWRERVLSADAESLAMVHRQSRR